INGKTHVTATVNDAIRLGIPAIFPQHYPLPEVLKPVVGTYDQTADFKTLLLRWIQEKTYNQHKQQMATQLQPYAKAQTRLRFQSYVRQLKQTTPP
ncbi:MAG: hypothetical protein AAF985_26355, partial [Bacteroidota bacterium]